MLARELGAERPDGRHHHHLELVRDLTHEGTDLLHQPVHTALTASLQQGGDGQGGDAAVHVSDEVLQVQVAGGDGSGVCHRDLTGEQRAGEFHYALGMLGCCMCIDQILNAEMLFTQLHQLCLGEGLPVLKCTSAFHIKQNFKKIK